MRIRSLPVSLLLATTLSLLGNGLLTTLAALRLADAALPDALVGPILSAYFAGITVGTLVLSPTVQRVGHIRAFGAFTALAVAAAIGHGLVPVGAAWVGHGLVPASAAWVGLRAISGLAMAGIYITVESWLSGSASEETRGRVMAAYLVALYLGYGLGQLVLPAWPEATLEAFAVAALALSVAAIPVALTERQQPELEITERLTPAELVRAAPIGAVGSVVSGFIGATIYTSVPVAARALGLEADAIATWMMAFVFGGLLGQWPIGWASDRMDRRSVLARAALGVAVCGAGLHLLAGEAFARHALALGFGALAFSLYPLAVSHTLDRVGSGRALPAAAQLLLASSLGAVAGPIVVGAVTPWLGASAVWVVDGVAGVALATTIGVRRLFVPPARQDPFVAVPRTTFGAVELDPRTDGPADAPGPDPESVDEEGLPALRPAEAD